MLLSIGMMVKNEEKYLYKCLNALTPILKSLEAELIIVDTGSSDKTVEIAKKFTDKVYYHEWNNDFAAMRNTVLEYCNGTWFFFVDADEIIEDCSELIEFFKSKEYLKYMSACIGIENILGTNSNLFFPPRLFKNDKEFIFKGIIHEQPLIREPIKYLNVNCKHYGYITSDKELMEKKFNRNIALLKDALFKDPDNIYNLYQIATSYSMYGEHKEAIKYIEEAYRLTRKLSDKRDHLYVYQALCVEYNSANNYEDVEKYALEGLEVKQDYIDFYFFLGIAQMNLGKIQYAISAYNSYINLIENFDKLGKNITFTYYSLNYANEIYCYLADLYLKEENYEAAISNLLKTDENQSNIQVLLSSFIDKVVKSKNYQLLKKYEMELTKINRKKQLDSFYSNLEKYKLVLKNEEVNFIEEAISDGDEDYNILNKLRVEFRKKDSIEIKLYKNFISNIDLSEKSEYYGDVIYFLLLEKYDMAKLLSNCTFNKISSYFQYISEIYENTSQVIYDYIMNTEIKDKFIYIRFYKELLHYLIILDGLTEEEKENAYVLYIQYGFKYINLLYTDFIIDRACINDVKNQEEAFLILLHKAFRYKENNVRLYIKALKEALEIMNPMKSVIEYLLKQME